MMRRLFPLFGLSLILWSSPLWAADWPMFGGGVTHVAVSADTPAVAPAPTVQWSADLGGSVDGSPAIVANRVFVGNSDGIAYAVNAADGTVIWRYRTGGALLSSPAVNDGRVFIGSADRFLYALDAATGRLNWRCRTWAPVVGSPVLSSGKVLFGSMDGVLRAVSETSGELLWKSSKHGAISAAPAVVGDSVIYADEVGGVHAVAFGDGHPLWDAKVSGPVMATPSAFGNVVLIPVMAPTALSPVCIDYLVALDVASGQRLWGLRDAKGGSVSATTTPAIVAGHCYVTTTEGYLSDSRLRCVDLATGELHWQGQLGGVGDSSPAVSGENVFLGCHDGALWGWSTKTYRPVTRLQLDTKIFSSPAIVGGRIYIGVQGGKLLCLG